MRNPRLATVVLGTLLAGCATAPLPDGSKIQRLAEPAAPVALTPEEAGRLAELNAQILREQNEARLFEERLEAWRTAPVYAWRPVPYFDAAWVYGHHGWTWRPRFGVGFGWGGAWPYW